MSATNTTAIPPTEHPQVEISDVLIERVRSGLPIYVLGAMNEVQGASHVALVNRLLKVTGKPVHVVHG